MKPELQLNDCANQSQSDLIPPNNYLWKSPDGIAYPGWHHQLILHLTAQKQSVWSNPSFADIKARLRQHPEYAIDDNSLQAIIQEYLQLNLQTRWAYRDMGQSILPTKNQPPIDANMEVDWESIIDPALFDHNDHSSTPMRDLESSPQPSSGSTTATQYSEVFSKPIENVIEYEVPVNSLRSMFDRGLRQSSWNTNPTTPTKIISIPTPSRPYPDRFRQEQCELISPTPRSINSQYSIDRDVGRILFFSKRIHDSRQKSTMAESREVDLIGLPDPTKYIQTSKKHYTIPESEAAAFIYWFEPRFDTLPDKIEGYYWYCDKCYIGEVSGQNGGNIRGKFNQRRSVQKHHEMVHRNTWKPVLPELDRSVAVKGTEDVENHGLDATKTPRRKLFNEFGSGGVGSRESRREVNGGQRDVGGSVTTVRRKGGEALFDFADISQVAGSEQSK